MIRWIVFVVLFAVLSPSAAQAACARWDMSGTWKFVQTNGTSPTFVLQQTPNGLQGRAEYTVFLGVFQTVTASVDGALNGDALKVTAYWDNGTTGVYTGTVGPQGRIVGSTYDAQNPQSTANWYSDRTANCLPSAAGGPALGAIGGAIKPPPVKALGREQPLTVSPALPTTTLSPPLPTTVSPPLPICEAARQARARNNAAAPGLEAKCRAAGGIVQP
jgi:hypothetical protein